LILKVRDFMRSTKFTFGLIVSILLLVVLLPCTSLSAGSQGESPFRIRRNIKIERPPADEPTVQVAATTYGEMLGKGYVRIGEISGSTEKRGYSEKSARAELLKEANKCGAEVVWLSISTESLTGGRINPAGASTDYHTGQVVLSGPKFAKRKYKEISGRATLFFYDPGLAAKQLEEGRNRWTTRAAAVTEKRAVLLAKLDRLRDALSAIDAPLLNKKQDLDAIRCARTIVETSRYKSFYDGSDTWIMPSEPKAVPRALGVLFSDTEETGTLFKDPRNPQRIELYKLASDASSYAYDNWAVFCDFWVLTLPEHVLWD
jgi:hypothetical protein